MNVTSCGYCYRHPKTFVIDRPKGSGDWLFLVVKSRAWFELSGERVEADSDSVILFRKGTPQRYGALDGEYVNDWIHFEADENDLALWERLGIPTDRLIPLGTSASLSLLVREILDERNGASEYSGEVSSLLGGLIWYRLAELCRLDQPREMQAHYERIKEIRNRIYRSPDQAWQVDEMARSAALSRSYFQHLYARFFGVAVSEDILSARISHAKYLLVSTKETVASVAERCGYKSDVHFMRQFKRSVGMRPTEYRKKGEGYEASALIDGYQTEL